MLQQLTKIQNTKKSFLLQQSLIVKWQYISAIEAFEIQVIKNLENDYNSKKEIDIRD